MDLSSWSKFYQKQAEKNLIQEKEWIEAQEKKYTSTTQFQKQGWKRFQKLHRLLKTKNGNVKFSYWKYYRRVNAKIEFHFPLFKILNISRNERISKYLQLIIFKAILEGEKSYKRLQQRFSFIKSQTTFTNIINNFEKNFVFDFETCILDISSTSQKILVTKYLYLDIDDTWKTFRQQSRQCLEHRMRHVKFHLGKDKNGNLLHKRVFSFIVPKGKTIDPLRFTFLLWKHIKLYYQGNWKKITLIFNTDGAKCFQTIISYLKYYFQNVKFILDKFHAYQNIKRCFSAFNTKTCLLKEQCKNFFSQGKFVALDAFLTKLISKHASRKMIRLQKYFQIHKEGVINQRGVWNIGASFESDMSYFKSHFGFGNKIFSLRVFKQLWKFLQAQINMNFQFNHQFFHTQRFCLQFL